MTKLKTLCFLLLFVCVLTNCSTAQQKSSSELPNKKNEDSDKVNPQTNRFESKAGNFSINIAQAPIQTRNLEGEEGQEPGKQFAWQFERTSYTVLYSAFNTNDLSQAFDDMNSGVRKTLLRNGSQSISENEISFGKYPGREFRYITPKGFKQIGRNYIVNNMGYLLTAGYVDEEGEKEGIKILDSFKLLNEKN